MQRSVALFDNERVRIAAVLIVIFSCYLSAIAFSPVNTGSELDGSWQYALSKTAELKPPAIFGKDIIFTYGPMGSFLERNVLPSEYFALRHLLQYLFGLAFLMLSAYVLCVFARMSTGWKFWLLVLIAFIYPVIGTLSDVQWVQLGLLLAVMAALPQFSAAQKRFALFALAPLAAAGLLLKFSIGFHLLALMAVALAIGLAVKPERRFAIFTFCSYIFWLVIFWSASTGAGIPSLLTYIREGLVISSNYSEYMIWNAVGGSLGPLLYLVPLAIILADIFLGSSAGSTPLALLLAVNSFLLFKLGFVRFDAHMFGFFAGQWYILLCFAALYPGNSGKSLDRKLLIGLLIVWLISYQGARSWHKPFKMFAPEGTVISQLADVPRSLDPIWSFNDAKKRSAANFADLKKTHHELFAKIDKYCSPSSTITFLPRELSFAENVKAKWVPLPTLQLYGSEQAPHYMEKDHQLFAGAGAPDFVVLGDQAIDGRSPVGEMSHIITDLIERYQIADRTKGYLVLRKTAQRSKLIFSPNEGVRPASLIFVKASHVKAQPLFSLQTALFKGPQFSIVIRTPDGKEAKWRVYASQLERGEYFGLPGDDLARLFEHKERKIRGSISISFVPEVFAGGCINKEPKLEVKTCSFTKGNR